MDNTKEFLDDGSLECLNIPVDRSQKRFNCDEIRQSKLVNKEFYVIDFFENMKTKYGSERYLVKIKFNLDDDDSEARKFFTNSGDIKYILNKLREMDKLPRRVTMCCNGNIYYFK